jgi:hypothetical protein
VVLSKHSEEMNQQLSMMKTGLNQEIINVKRDLKELKESLSDINESLRILAVKKKK